jgi:hypothetical protein
VRQEAAGLAPAAPAWNPEGKRLSCSSHADIENAKLLRQMVFLPSLPNAVYQGVAELRRE